MDDQFVCEVPGALCPSGWPQCAVDSKAEDTAVFSPRPHLTEGKTPGLREAGTARALGFAEPRL